MFFYKCENATLHISGNRRYIKCKKTNDVCLCQRYCSEKRNYELTPNSETCLLRQGIAAAKAKGEPIVERNMKNYEKKILEEKKENFEPFGNLFKTKQHKSLAENEDDKTKQK